MLSRDNMVVRIFDSVRQAHRQTNIDHRSISAVAGGSAIRKVRVVINGNTYDQFCIFHKHNLFERQQSFE